MIGTKLVQIFFPKKNWEYHPLIATPNENNYNNFAIYFTSVHIIYSRSLCGLRRLVFKKVERKGELWIY